MDSFVVEGTLGVNDMNTLEMSIYPNPVDGNYVTIQTPTNGLKEVEVFDLQIKYLNFFQSISWCLNCNIISINWIRIYTHF